MGLDYIQWRASIGNLVIVDELNNDAIGTIYYAGSTPNYNMNNVLAGAAAGYKVASAINQATSTETVTTGLTTLTGYTIAKAAGSAATANTAVSVTGNYSAGVITAYRWKHKTATNPTLIAATTAGSMTQLAVGT